MGEGPGQKPRELKSSPIFITFVLCAQANHASSSALNFLFVRMKRLSPAPKEILRAQYSGSRTLWSRHLTAPITAPQLVEPPPSPGAWSPPTDLEDLVGEGTAPRAPPCTPADIWAREAASERVYSPSWLLPPTTCAYSASPTWRAAQPGRATQRGRPSSPHFMASLFSQVFLRTPGAQHGLHGRPQSRGHVMPIRGVLAKNQKISVAHDMKKLQPVYTADGEYLKCFKCHGKLYGFPQKIKHTITIFQQFHFWIYPERLKAGTRAGISTPTYALPQYHSSQRVETT